MTKPSNLQAYKDRVRKAAEAEGYSFYEANERRWEVREEIEGYHEARATIRIRAGKIACHGEDEKKYGPSDEEKAAIEAELPTLGLPASIVASDAEFKDLKTSLRDWVRETEKGSGKWVTTAKLIAAHPIRGMSRSEIVTVQVRYENASDGKKFFQWRTLFDVKGERTWRSMEPDLDHLPFWKPEKSRDKASIMVHEGVGKAAEIDDLVNNPERREELELHPWAEDLRDYEHWGAVTGARMMHRCDYSELRAAGVIGELVYVCDNDHNGKQAARAFSQYWGKRLGAVMFDNGFNEGWDLADKVPAWVAEKSKKLRDFIRPATWATVSYLGPKQGAYFKLTDAFEREWFHIVVPPAFVHRERPSKLYDAQQTDHCCADFAHDGARVSKLIEKIAATKAETVVYEPGLRSGFHNNPNGENTFNIHCAPHFVRFKKAPDASPFVNLIDILFQIELEREIVSRWLATLIARPGLKMHFGQLWISRVQGVGKTTLADLMEGVLGPDNVTHPNESAIVNSQFTGWQKGQLISVQEIYSGRNAKAYTVLKELITDKRLRINEKNIKEYHIDNKANIIACSNSLNALLLDNTDRRWFVPKVTDVKQPHEHWKRLRHWADYEDGYHKIWHWAHRYLETHSQIEPGMEAPLTVTKREVIHSGYSRGQLFIEKHFTFVKQVWDSEGKVVRIEHQHMEEVNKLIKLCEKREPFFMFDVAAQAAIKIHLYNEREDAKLDSALRIRRVAEGAGLFCGRHEDRNRSTQSHGPETFNGVVISPLPGVASTPVSALDAAYINLVSLIDDLEPLRARAFKAKSEQESSPGSGL